MEQFNREDRVVRTVTHQKPLQLPTDQNQIVENMAPVEFSPESAQQERDRYDAAIAHMRNADRHRVMNFTGLRSPFAKNRRNG